MNTAISFPCRVCGGVGDPRAAPGWAAQTAIEPVFWSASPEPVTGRFELLTQAPAAGSTQLVRVEPPFHLADTRAPFWTLYRPPLSSLNGWEEAPTEIAESVLARCAVRAAGPVAADHAWLRLEILETLPLSMLVSWPEAHGDVPLALPFTIRVTFADYALFDLNLEGDAGAWLLCRRTQGRWRLILDGEWGCHFDVAHAGHRPLSPAEAAELGLVS